MSVRPLFLCLSVLSLVTACAVPVQREERVVYASAPVMAEYGRVDNIGVVALASRPTGAGAVLGAVIGGVLGHQVGGGGGKALATGAGAIGGAIAGNAIEGGLQRRADEAYRVQVRFDNGSMRAFDFERIGDLRVGDRVKFEGGQLHRL